jgi:hypothetical protein
MNHGRFKLQLLQGGEAAAKARFLAAGGPGMDDAGLGSFIEARGDFRESPSGFIFFPCFQIREKAFFQRFQTGFDLLISRVLASAVSHAPFG